MVRSEIKPPESSIIRRTWSIVEVDVLAMAERAAGAFFGPKVGDLNHLKMVDLLTVDIPGIAWIAGSEFSIRWCKLSPTAFATKFFTFSFACLSYILLKIKVMTHPI